jgi:hypothetical protein
VSTECQARVLEMRKAAQDREQQDAELAVLREEHSRWLAAFEQANLDYWQRRLKYPKQVALEDAKQVAFRRLCRVLSCCVCVDARNQA